MCNSGQNFHSQRSEFSFNIQRGCSANCVYCYSKYNALHKYKNIKSEEEWLEPVINIAKANKKWEKMDGLIMFPTTHDIDPNNIEYSLTTLKNILKVGNEVLIVSKPNYNCIVRLTDQLKEYKDKILFRFTITSSNNSVLKIMEPGASSYEERIKSLKLAYEKGFNTSVSIEPLIGGLNELDVIYEAVCPYVNDTIWVGKMNKIEERVNMKSAEVRKIINYINAEQTDDKIFIIYDAYHKEEFIEWKDSIKNVIKKY
jgi:DNA repair photolyase